MCTNNKYILIKSAVDAFQVNGGDISAILNYNPEIKFKTQKGRNKVYIKIGSGTFELTEGMWLVCYDKTPIRILTDEKFKEEYVENKPHD